MSVKPQRVIHSNWHDPVDSSQFIYIGDSDGKLTQIGYDAERREQMYTLIMADPTHPAIQPQLGGLRLFKHRVAISGIGYATKTELLAKVLYGWFPMSSTVLIVKAFGPVEEVTLEVQTRKAVTKLLHQMTLIGTFIR
ncbi:hypothetical protein BH09PLA1_BH09PLA1_25840 [soil metagenome]